MSVFITEVSAGFSESVSGLDRLGGMGGTIKGLGGVFSDMVGIERIGALEMRHEAF